MIGYFAQWGIYGRNYRVKNIDTSGSAAKITHINYAFGNVRNNRCEVGVTQPSDPNTGVGGDAFADYTKAFGAGESVSGAADTWDQPLRGNWNQLKQLKAKHPSLKVLISLGGWTWSRGFSSAARPENRVAFVASCVDAYIRGNLPVTDGAGGAGAAAGVFDGIDLDWEYPVACGLTCGTPEDNANFTALLAEFRRQLNAVRPGLLLTIAAGAGVDKVARHRSGARIAQYLDYINVMTYDFHGTWDAQTNHHSALFDSPNDPSTGDQKFYNSNDAMEAFLSRGVPASKLNLGIGFYGRGWTNVPNVNNGLYQSGTRGAGHVRSRQRGLQGPQEPARHDLHRRQRARDVEVRRQHVLELRHAGDGHREDELREGAEPGRRVLLGVQRRRCAGHAGQRDQQRPEVRQRLSGNHSRF